MRHHPQLAQAQPLGHVAGQVVEVVEVHHLGPLAPGQLPQPPAIQQQQGHVAQQVGFAATDFDKGQLVYAVAIGFQRSAAGAAGGQYVFKIQTRPQGPRGVAHGIQGPRHGPGVVNDQYERLIH
ncbi:hypothetical protein BEN49_05470 [Hymenobacter coccineus]|uniref:Uncharacterized protein n=1 Tax=Hymenobacter coccineus TaxID=1908235 RepID=A0A1G1TJM3_9BACT|nr:hypothetical protein BEN49_05470 [Hymenobacter coccineus]